MINDADLDGPNLTLPKAMLRRRPDIMVSTELVVEVRHVPEDLV